MPTVSWILEKAVERFWEDRSPIRTGPPPRSPVFRCRYCGRELRSRQDLSQHYNLEHPLQLPVLYIGGEALLQETVVRVPFSAADVALVHCTRCEVDVDGGSALSFSADEFAMRVAQATNSTWKIRLLHERAVDGSRAAEHYAVRFRIPNPATLDKVDEYFVETLAVDNLTHSHLRRFESLLPRDAAGREYGAALGEYALGVLLKEQRVAPRAELGFQEFVIKMRTALETLRLFDRPVAVTVTRSIRFNLNEFSKDEGNGATELETALQFFRNITANSSPDLCKPSAIGARAVRHPACPIDSVSHELLKAAELLAHGSLSLYAIERVRQLMRGPIPISEQDLAKIHVICAEGYLRLGQTADALLHLHPIRFDPSLHEWAQSKLRSIEHDV